MLLANLFFGLIDPFVIDLELTHNLSNNIVIKIEDLANLSILSIMGFVPKYNGGSQKIYHLSYLKNSSIKDYFGAKSSMLFYTSL